MVVEIRTYRVVPGTLEEFVELMRSRAVPLLAEHGIDVLGCGASLEPGDGDPRDAYLVRAFPDEAARDAAEAAFYGSDAWRSGPQPEVLARIETFHTIVLELSPAATEALRAELA